MGNGVSESSHTKHRYIKDMQSKQTGIVSILAPIHQAVDGV